MGQTKELEGLERAVYIALRFQNIVPMTGNQAGELTEHVLQEIKYQADYQDSK